VSKIAEELKEEPRIAVNVPEEESKIVEQIV